MHRPEETEVEAMHRPEETEVEAMHRPEETEVEAMHRPEETEVEDSASSSEEGEDEIPTEPQFREQVSVEQQLEDVLKWMREDKRQWKDIPEDTKRRLTQNTTHSSGPTALHILVHILVHKGKGSLPDNTSLKALVDYLVKSDQNLLLQVDDNSGYTPLHWAIYWRTRSMVKWICGAYGNIDEVLKICGTKLKRNCIHLAIEHAKSGTDKTAKGLVDLASAETLAAKDEEGNTPLHLAVAYEKCKKGQIDLVKAIVEKADYFIRKQPGVDFNNAPALKSPYLHHLSTTEAAERAREEADATITSKPVSKRPDQGHSGVGHRANMAATMSASGERESSVGPGQGRSTTTPQAARLEPTGKTGLRNSAREAFNKREREPRQPSRSVNFTLPPNEGMSQFPDDLPSTESMLQYPGDPQPTEDMPQFPGDGTLQTKKTSVAVSEVSSTNNAEYAQEIREFLKKHYLRSRGQDAALEILYGRTPSCEKAISFDLSGYSSLTKSEIEQHISILNFETTLQYLEIPKISPTEQRVQPKARNSRAQVAFQDGEGRTDVPVVFQQLRQKGVETILEVTIDDLEHPAHSDWAIEKALRFDNSTRDMNIEAWNWKKVDICPDLVFSVASGATSIQLYWSGGNAVLRAWSEAEGLPKLTKLRHVVLHVQKGYLDTRQRVEDNIKAFRERLIEHTARVRATEVLDKLKLKESTRERTSITIKDFSELLHQELVKGIVDASSAKKKIPRHLEQLEKKKVVDRAKASIKEFFSSERKQEDSIPEQAKRRAKMRAKEIAADVASTYFDMDIEVYYPGGSRRIYNNAGQSADGYLEEPQKHEWIQCMTDFRKLLYNAEKNFLSISENQDAMRRSIEETGGPILVALIDDGIEVAEIRLDKSVSLTGRSFFPKPLEKNSDKNVSYPWYWSSKGHGTVMASQIHRIAPKVNLSVLKLHDFYHPQSNKRHITPKSAAQAIREATRRKAHIISMSWTITPPTNETDEELEDLKELESAIMEASKANILMFCSASDEGAKQDDTYPSKALSGKIFKIGGADANGGLYDRVGDITAVNFILPGQLVASEELSDTALKVQYWNGSSIATALAAGLAALILYCAQIRIARARSDKEKKLAKRQFELLHKYEKMKDVFQSLCVRSQGPTGKYPAVWDVFGEKVKASKNINMLSQQGELIDLVANVARELCVRL